jgi:predicted phosphate transport protein (TIGR00153 family)
MRIEQDDLVSLPGVAFGRREGTIMRAVQEELRIVRETEQEIPGLVAAVAEVDEASCRNRRDRIYELESKAADAKRDLSTQIAEGAFFGGVREDLINLLDKIEKIADKAKDAARLITLADITDAKAREILRSEDMRLFLANLDLAVVALQHLIEAFEIDRKTILQRVHAVEEYEEAADTFKQNILAALFERSRGIDPVTVIVVRDFVFSADDVADYAEYASDVVLVLVAKGYG